MAATNGRKSTTTSALRQRAWYFTHIFADPKSADTVYMLNTGLFRSTDGGKSFNLLPAPHGDHHGLWIDPTNPQRMINGNDGGATITVDGGKTWTHAIQSAHRAVLPRGRRQSVSSITSTVRSRTIPRWPSPAAATTAYIGRQHWYDVGGGESGYIAPDPRDANIVYAGPARRRSLVSTSVRNRSRTLPCGRLMVLVMAPTI